MLVPCPVREALLLKFVAHHLWDPARRESDGRHGMPAEVADQLGCARGRPSPALGPINGAESTSARSILNLSAIAGGPTGRVSTPGFGRSVPSPGRSAFAQIRAGRWPVNGRLGQECVLS
jgi:hypothetical protein